MTDKLVLAFDLGAYFGWACGAYGVSDDTYGSKFCPGERPLRLRNFMDAARQLIREKKPDLVVYELPFARGDAATRSLKGMAGVLEAVAADEKVAVLDAGSPVTFKKHWTGNARASKEEMIAEATRRGYAGIGKVTVNEHEADALAILSYTLKHLEME